MKPQQINFSAQPQVQQQTPQAHFVQFVQKATIATLKLLERMKSVFLVTLDLSQIVHKTRKIYRQKVVRFLVKVNVTHESSVEQLSEAAEGCCRLAMSMNVGTTQLLLNVSSLPVKAQTTKLSLQID